MAGETGQTAPDLGAYLQARARHYAFFQAVELVQSHLDDGQEVGTHTMARDEHLFFAVDANLAFPTSDIVSIKPLPEMEPGEQVRFMMTVSFLGLHGANSPLPSYYPETVARYAGADESVLKSFFDFFHNRVIGLLHRIWRKYRYYQRYRPGGTDVFSGYMFSLFGLGDAEARRSTQVYWPRLLCFSGVLATRNRSPGILSTVIAHAFELKRVEIEEWVHHKVSIPQDQRSSTGQRNMVLGESMLIGDRISDRQSKFRIELHGLTYRRFSDFLPHGKDFHRLRGLVEFMLRDQLAYDLRLCLAPHEARPMTLHKQEEGRLGWSTFLGEGKVEDARPVIIRARS